MKECARFMLPELMLCAARSRLRHANAARCEERDALTRKRENLHVAGRRVHCVEACESALENRVLRAVADLHVPAESLVAVRDRTNRGHRDIAQERLLAVAHRADGG